MKNALLFCFVMMAIFAGFALTTSAYASDVGVVDVRRLLEQSAAGKSIQSALKVKRDALQKEANEFEKKMRNQEQQLIKNRKDMKAEEFEVKKKSFEEEFVKTRQSILKRTTDLDNQRKVALRKMQENIGKVTADIADEKKIKLVVDRELVVIVDQSLDLTEEALKMLDERVKSIPLE